MIVELGNGIDIFLQPGDWFFGDEHTRIRTVLGSCIAVTLWHPIHRRGGMCHYMLPGTHPYGEMLDGRYAEDALRLLLRETARHGDCPGDYEVKLFGGAAMFGANTWKDSVAERNVEAAQTLMTRHGLLVRSHSLGGACSRQLIFNLADGSVWVRQGISTDCENVA